MRLSIEQPKFSALLSRVIGAVERRNTIPILSNILLSTDGTQLKATATDLDLEIRSSEDATVETEGATTVNASMLAAMVNKMSKGALITITAENQRVNISNGKASFDLATLPVEDFPNMAGGSDYNNEFTAPANEIHRLLDKTSFCMSTDEVRYFLQGVYLHSVEGCVRAVTTDGHRLAQVDSDISAEFDGVIIPRKAVAEMRKALDSNADAIVNVSGQKVKLTVGETTIITKVIDGTYPDYKRVIPSDCVFNVVGDAKEMKQASDLVALVSGERTKAVRMEHDDGVCKLSVDTGQNHAEESVKVEANGNFVVGFNAKYFAEAMQQCGDGNVTLKFSESAPVVILPEDDEKALYICMPMKLY